FDYCQFDNAFTFIYSPRVGTPAALMEDNIPFEVKQERLQRLNEKANYYATKQNMKYKDKVVEVLVDGLSKKNENTYSGYTDTNKLVNFTGNNLKRGDIVKVYIDVVKTWSLNGKQI
ncbi:MAG: TRAM domain-containing protein, partial [Erysipelotrichales bacterium]